MIAGFPRPTPEYCGSTGLIARFPTGSKSEVLIARVTKGTLRLRLALGTSYLALRASLDDYADKLQGIRAVNCSRSVTPI
jgi:hypothetical protein